MSLHRPFLQAMTAQNPWGKMSELTITEELRRRRRPSYVEETPARQSFLRREEHHPLNRLDDIIEQFFRFEPRLRPSAKTAFEELDKVVMAYDQYQMRR